MHVSGWSVLGVWELRHDPLLLRLRPLWIARDQVEHQHTERQRIERQLMEWQATPADSPGELTWQWPFQPLRDAPGSFWGTPRELQALVPFLMGWLGDDLALLASPPLHCFRLRTRPRPEEPPNLKDLVDVDEAAPWREAPFGEPPEDSAPWPSDEDARWEPDIPASAPPDEVPEWESIEREELSEESEEPLPSWDPEELYFGEPAYTYTPSPDIPGASERYTMVVMPTWQRAGEGVIWGGRPRLRQDPQLGLVVADAFSVVSHRLEDLRDPDFDPYLELGLGYIDLDRLALQELLELLQEYIDEYVHTASKAALVGGEDGTE